MSFFYSLISLPTNGFLNLMLNLKGLFWKKPTLLDRYLTACALFAIIYILTGQVGLSLDTVSGFAAFVWPPAGLALAGLLIFGPGLWPGVFAGALVVNLFAGATVWVSVGIGIGNTLEALLGYFLLKKLVQFRLSMNRLIDVLSLILLAGLISTLVSASLGTVSLFLGNFIESNMIWKTWCAWWLGDFFGILIVAPFLLIWLTQPFKKIPKQIIFEFSFLLITLGVLSLNAQIDKNANGFSVEFQKYLLIPLFVWTPLRLQIRGAVSVNLIVSAIAIGLTLNGLGPFAVSSFENNLFFMLMFVGTLAITSLMLAAVICEFVTSEELAKRIQSEAILDSAAKSSFITSVSHEIRTPLSAVLGFAEMIRKFPISEEERERYLDIIIQSGGQLSQLIDSILDLSKIESGRMYVENSTFLVRNFLIEILQLLEIKAVEKKLELVFEVDSSVPENISTDATKLRQILINIIGNAIKFTENGSVSVRVYSSDKKKISFSVKDTGPGISDLERKNLFHASQPVNESMTRKNQGSGIGLTLSNKLAVALGGGVALAPTGSTPGSTFIITISTDLNRKTGLSRRKSKAQLSNERVKSLPNLSGLKILLVEDCPTNQILIEKQLLACGIELEIASNGKIGVERALKENFDAILMDIQMPELDGYAATVQLRKLGCHVPIIALTAHVYKQHKEQCNEIGFSDFLSKPTLVEELARVIYHHTIELKTDP